MNVDKILQWCIFSDYPLFRAHAKKYRDKVNKIILYPSRQHGVLDLEQFAKDVFKETWVDPVPINYGIEDWRQAETIPCLKYSNSEWLWFSEQDFFVKNWDKFYEDIELAMHYSDMIGWWNPTHFPYIHPSCLFIKREMLEKTQKDFRAHPEINGADHFAMLTKDVQTIGGKITTLQDLGYEDWKDAFHLGSLTYTFQDWKGGTESDRIGARSPEAFMVYNYWMRKVEIQQNSEFLKLSEEIETFFKPRFPDLNLENNEWVEFFR